MTRDVVATTRSASLENVVEMMGRRHIKRLPVVEDGKLVGIIARSDLLKALALHLAAEPADAGGDEAVRKAVVAELGRQFWSSNGLVRVDVEGGIVTLSGTIFDERERQAARVVAENAPGVKSVEDQLVCVEPISGVIIMPPPRDPDARS
jgi:CBS domain-containing protein